LDDMPQQFAASDLVLARSGASTVAELAASGKPSLLTPFPRAADDHQRKNAEAMVEAGAAAMLLEEQMTSDRLLAEIRALLGDPARLTAMGERARALARPGAALRIAQMAAELAGHSSFSD
jgi:UDP-N-acetylglucosamine--N-acetylmuramyl-(pentapeptide) pyrophosphoryl-undecaprenol N-acetylglucosamine transferase